MGSNQSNTSHVIGSTSTWVEFEDDWFAQGVSRYAYRGTYHGNPRTEGKKCVVKVYKEEWYDRLGEYAWKADDRASRKAQEMAELFNIKYQTSKPLQFIQPQFTRISTRAAFNFLGFIPFERNVKGKLAGTRDAASNVIPDNATVAVESYLEGEYVKFLNNSGYVDPKFTSSPAAFSHFTYHKSGGRLLVCDLQGVRSKTRYEFTDPAIHSTGSSLNLYGPTDLGAYGIVKFFRTHSCNPLCQGLKKPNMARMTPHQKQIVDRVLGNIPSDQSSSTYTYQLNAGTDISDATVRQIQNDLNLGTIDE